MHKAFFLNNEVCLDYVPTFLKSEIIKTGEYLVQKVSVYWSYSVFFLFVIVIIS